MRYKLAGLVTLLTLASLAISAQGADIVCKPLTIPISGVPKDVIIKITIKPEDLLKQCTSGSAKSLKVSSLAEGVSVSPTAKSKQTIPFTVKDEKGNAVEASVIVTRE